MRAISYAFKVVGAWIVRCVSCPPQVSKTSKLHNLLSTPFSRRSFCPVSNRPRLAGPSVNASPATGRGTAGGVHFLSLLNAPPRLRSRRWSSRWPSSQLGLLRRFWPPSPRTLGNRPVSFFHWSIFRDDGQTWGLAAFVVFTGFARAKTTSKPHRRRTLPCEV